MDFPNKNKEINMLSLPTNILININNLSFSVQRIQNIHGLNDFIIKRSPEKELNYIQDIGIVNIINLLK